MDYVEYRGWVLNSYVAHDDGDCIKRQHDAVPIKEVHPSACTQPLDFSPYQIPDLETFQMFVDLGFPDRARFRKNSPVTKEDLIAVRNVLRAFS